MMVFPDVEIDDGPYLTVSPFNEYVLIDWIEGDSEETLVSGQWVLSVAEAHRLAVALYTVSVQVSR